MLVALLIGGLKCMSYLCAPVCARGWIELKGKEGGRGGRREEGGENMSDGLICRRGVNRSRDQFLRWYGVVCEQGGLYDWVLPEG